jgi:hypothetical protein
MGKTRRKDSPAPVGGGLSKVRGGNNVNQPKKKRNKEFQNKK